MKLTAETVGLGSLANPFPYLLFRFGLVAQFDTFEYLHNSNNPLYQKSFSFKAI